MNGQRRVKIQDKPISGTLHKKGRPGSASIWERRVAGILPQQTISPRRGIGQAGRIGRALGGGNVA